MPLPTSYSETELKDFMHAVLAETAAVLGWSVGAGSYDEAVNETLFAYGTDDIAPITGQENIRKLRILARVEAWRAVLAATAADYDFAADGGKYSRSQVHGQAEQILQQAKLDALPYLNTNRVAIDKVRHIHDPYHYIPDEVRIP